MKLLIIFLIRKRLGVKNEQPFRFDNQKSDSDFYVFIGTILVKYVMGKYPRLAHVSLNWLLDDECKVTVIDKPELED